jgi:hypothetical protein
MRITPSDPWFVRARTSTQFVAVKKGELNEAASIAEMTRIEFQQLMAR